jgi:hypothetical protein
MSYLTGWAAQPSEDIKLCFFSRADEPSEDIQGNTVFISDKYEGKTGPVRRAEMKNDHPKGP